MIERSGRADAGDDGVARRSCAGPVPLAKALAAIDVLSEGRLVAARRPGLLRRDYDAVGIPFEERWKRFDEAIAVLRALLARPLPGSRYYPPADVELAPGPRGESRSGSGAGARRRASLASRGRPTAGSRPPTTRRRSASPPRAPPGARARGRGRDADGLPQRARHDVDLGLEDRAEARPRARRRPGSAPAAAIPTSCARRSASAPPSTAPSSSRATPRPAASASTCGRWATSGDSSSWSRATWRR